MRTTVGWQQAEPGSTVMQRAVIERRDLRPDDIAVRIDFCGVCHSDLHAVHGVMGQPLEPLVPGHEFTGVVTAAGSDVTAFAVGDRVAVGTLIDSCGVCAMCEVGQENFCLRGAIGTYATLDPSEGRETRGGYSREYVLRAKYAYALPAGLDPAAAAPLMCAGITVWEPMRAAGVGPGSRVAIAGLGGLGHLGVKFAAALGAEVTVLSRTPDKLADALKLGATDMITTTDEEQAAGAFNRFDFILDTISAPHDLGPLLAMLRLDGTLSVVGMPIEVPVQIMNLTFGRKKLTSSGTGGRRGTAEMLAFAADHGIVADVEVLPSELVNTAFERLERGDVRYRFVLDLADLDRVTA